MITLTPTQLNKITPLLTRDLDIATSVTLGLTPNKAFTTLTILFPDYEVSLVWEPKIDDWITLYISSGLGT